MKRFPSRTGTYSFVSVMKAQECSKGITVFLVSFMMKWQTARQCGKTSSDMLLSSKRFKSHLCNCFLCFSCYALMVLNDFMNHLRVFTASCRFYSYCYYRRLTPSTDDRHHHNYKKNFFLTIYYVRCSSTFYFGGILLARIFLLRFKSD